MKSTKFYLFSLGVVYSLASGSVSATSIGSDFNIKLTPAAAGMGGVGYVSPQDPVASVFGNPATLTQLKGDTDFSFGATYLNVFNKASADGTVVPAFSGDIEMEHYFLPEIAVRQRVTDNLVLGSGLQVVSGLGADYRTSSPLNPTVTYITYGANMAAAYALTPKTSIGGSLTLAYSLLEFGLVANTGIQETFGVRGGLGVTHDLGLVKLGLTYNSELSLDFEDVVQITGAGAFGDLPFEQPREVIVGLASTPSLWPNLLVEGNVIYKNWEDASVYEDIWQDTFTFQLGSQYSMNKLKLRAGYSYTTDILKKDGLGTTLGGLTTLNVGGATTAISAPLIQFIQSTLADPLWNHNITAGVGYDLSKTIHADLHVGYGFGKDRSIGANQIEVGIFSLGAGFTWDF